MSVFSAKSILFIATMTDVESAKLLNASVSTSGFSTFTIQITVCAFFIASIVRFIPRFSILSSVALIPAVSIRRNSNPSMYIFSSIVSRVVPGMSLTIARSSLRMAFISVDFPTFGLPIIATGMPFLMVFPDANEEVKLSICSFISFAICNNCGRWANSKSSWSEKSSSSSSMERRSRILSCIWSINFLNPPRNWFMAMRLYLSELAAITSATASA